MICVCVFFLATDPVVGIFWMRFSRTNNLNAFNTLDIAPYKCYK